MAIAQPAFSCLFLDGEEFVVAGDFLVYKFPLWSWQKGDAKPREHLPADKQYLLLQGAPCPRRATALVYTDAEEDAERLVSMEGGKEDEWVQTHAGRTAPTSHPDHIEDIPDDDALAADLQHMNIKADEIPDMEEDDLEDAMNSNIVQQSKPAPAEGTNSNIQKTRKYDAMITYDKYYQTPRLWLLGYDEDGTPLKPKQVFEDISADHANKTVTIEPFPHSTSLTLASVHPCKHSEVMKKVIERMNAGMIEEQRKSSKSPSTATASTSTSTSSGGTKKWIGGALRRVTGGGTSSAAEKSPTPTEAENEEGMKVDWYLVVFLKFLSSIVPTIELDSTSAF
ncbi:16833_t:CDS:2 [Acaulospora colombiana]|uniref:16833_t:CDS:1 n=1 Tax=Acaulospora colombiana TaxID=27376 RepID=A0ACA9MIY8_9GLOM|nr:16833_t:CDS:2 [Acaulospora colombiana]